MTEHERHPAAFFDGDGVGWNMEPGEQDAQPYHGYTRDRMPGLAIVVCLVVLVLLAILIASHAAN